MKRNKFQFLAVALFIISAIQIVFVSCDDDPGVENYYTSTKEYASDFLQNRPDQFSDYIQILNRATGETGNLRLLNLLGTYGQYTVFAPNNEAVRKYLVGKGLESVDQLTKEDCDTIALNSIIENGMHFISDFSQGTYPQLNMLSRIMKVSTDSATVNGKIVLDITVNNAKMFHYDDSVSNGVVHTMSSIVGTSNEAISDVLCQDSTLSIFAEALKVTGMSDSLVATRDYSYSVSPDSTDWTNKALCLHTAAEYDNVAYMKERLFMFTAFVETDEVYERYGITNLAELDEYAHKLYDDMYPEDAGVTDPTDRRNALNRFVSYHILPLKGDYYKLTAVDGDQKDQATSPSITKCIARRKIDICDWYETMMPHSLMKFSFPSGTQYGLYINRRGVQSRPDYRGTFVRGAKIMTAGDLTGDKTNEDPLVTTAVNGMFYKIDDIIAYDRNTQTVVLDERLRFDTSTLSPDFLTSGARGHYARNGAGSKNGKYAPGGQQSDPLTNNATCLGFKAGSAKNFLFEDAKTHIHVRNRFIDFWSYEGDELIVKGQFDFAIKLPPVPEGDYEVRMMTCVGFSSRGIMQAYIGKSNEKIETFEDVKSKIDLKPQGIPFDMRPSGEVLFGYTSDTNLGDDDAIQAFDKSIHNNGWMKGPGSYLSGSAGWSDIKTSFRNQNNTIRKVLGHFSTNGKEDVYLRLQQKMESSENEMNLDYIEIVRSSVYNNEYYPEDRW